MQAVYINELFMWSVYVVSLNLRDAVETHVQCAVLAAAKEDKLVNLLNKVNKLTHPAQVGIGIMFSSQSLMMHIFLKINLVVKVKTWQA